MGEKENLIDQTQARKFAKVFFQDVGTYIQSRQFEYEKYLSSLQEGDDLCNGTSKIIYRPQRVNGKAD